MREKRDDALARDLGVPRDTGFADLIAAGRPSRRRRRQTDGARGMGAISKREIMGPAL